MQPQSGSNDALLSVEEVAHHLDVQPVTVYRWCRSGRLRCLKPGKAWRIRQADLDMFLEQSQRPRTLTGYLDRFLAVPDHVFAVAEDARLLTQLDAAFFQVGAAHGGVLVKIYDPRAASQHGLAADLRHAGVPVERLETLGRLRWQPATDVEAGIAALEQILEEEAPAEQTIWAIVNWPGVDDMAAGLRQQARLATLIATHPRLVVATGVVEPEPAAWPSLKHQWQLLSSLRGMIRLAGAGLLLSRVVAPLPM
jgi:excisionase family DNA binding protein